MPGPYKTYEPSPPPVRELLPRYPKVCWCGGVVTASKQIHPVHGFRYRLRCWDDIDHDPETPTSSPEDSRP